MINICDLIFRAKSLPRLAGRGRRVCVTFALSALPRIEMVEKRHSPRMENCKQSFNQYWIFNANAMQHNKIPRRWCHSKGHITIINIHRFVYEASLTLFSRMEKHRALLFFFFFLRTEVVKKGSMIQVPTLVADSFKMLLLLFSPEIVVNAAS